MKEEEGICDSSGKKILSFGWGWHHLCWTWYSTFPVGRACTGQWQGYRAVPCQQFPIWCCMVLPNLSDTRCDYWELYLFLMSFYSHSCAHCTLYKYSAYLYLVPCTSIVPTCLSNIQIQFTCHENLWICLFIDLNVTERSDVSKSIYDVYHITSLECL